MILQIFLDGLTILTEKWPVVIGTILTICIGCYFVFHLWNKEAKGKNSPIHRLSLLLPFLFFAITVVFRLAFIIRAYAPAYFDSVEHFRIIKEVVKAFEASDFSGILTGLTPAYYHLGFHFIASLLTFSLRADPIDVILVFGQVTLAAIPIQLFFILQHRTKSIPAAFLGMFLAGFGWYMPGFAVNWGKYPAITGLLAFEIVLGVGYFVTQENTVRYRVPWFGTLLTGIFITIFIHSRMLVILPIAFGSWLLAGRIISFSRSTQYYLTGTLLAGIMILGTLIYREPLLNLALDPYLEDGVWVTLIVLILSPFAWIKFPRDSYSSILFLLGIFTCLFIPLNQLLPDFANQTLLDRPMVEMLLYFPLSVLGGLGIAGLQKIIGEMKPLPEQIHFYVKNLIVVLLIGFTGFISLKNYNFYPSDCCIFIGYDDTIAMDWLSRNTPNDVHILVPSTIMNVLPSGPTSSEAGTDAGIWIPNLAGREIVLMPFDTDFRLEDTTDQLCQKDVDYIYVGKTDQSFDDSKIQANPDRYKGVLLLPTVQLYKLTGCLPSE